MTSLQLLASAIFAAIFITVFASIYINYRAGAELDAFERGAEDLANRIRSLATQDAGAMDQFTLLVPKNCVLQFENQNLVAVVGSNTKYHDVGVKVIGPTITDQKVTLDLERTENGVVVSIG